ncbi:MAG: hypothetical protein CR991_01415 [Proteobacteria bacterium]|nr:MAG: hypothetical protein CR991_01415 [Pseudomonadota bacterium]
MNRFKKIFIFFLWLISLAGCDHKYSNEFESLGTTPFTVNTWKSASQEEKATMLHSFMLQYNVVGMSPKYLKELLGESTGYYDYDNIPAYLIGSDEIHSEYGNGYLLAFPLDHSTGLIKSYIIIPVP